MFSNFKMFTAVALYIILFFTFLYYFKSVKCTVQCYKEINKLPGHPHHNAILGNIVPLQTTPDKIFQILREWSRKYYPIYKVTVLHMAAACLLTPEDFELILSNSKHNNKSLIYNMLHTWLGTGLLTSNGKKWISRRKILTPAFHFSILQHFIIVFNEETDKLVEILKKECCRPFTIVNPIITQFTLKTIAETAMGTKLKFDTEKEIKYKNALYQVGEYITFRLLHSWYISDIINFFNPNYRNEKKAVETLHNFTKAVISDREKNFQEVNLPTKEDEVYIGKKRLAMLDLLLTAKKQDGVIDDEGIREEVDTFMFEGHDTTAAALSFALMLIACHKKSQEEIYQEIAAVLGDVHKKPTYKDLQEMKYLERVIKETLRLYPSVHFISRELGEDVMTSSGYILPKKSLCHLHIYDLHHNPDIYPDPEKFDPDRFLPENCQKRHPFAYVPFSAGPRNCIGQRFAMLELKSVLCGILANFVLEPVDTPDTIVLVVDFVLRTKDGIKVKFVPRT